jgi:phosphoglycolate phosphatase/pyrophosphatase PpaX
MDRIKAVIFDLDGTLGNTIPLCIEAFRKSIEPLINRTISDQEIIATFGPSEEGTIMALAPDSYEKGISSYLYFYEHLHEKCPKPFDGILNLLNILRDRKIRLAMVTGKGKHSTEISLRKFDITHYFEKIETGHRSGPRKSEGIMNVLNYFGDINKNEIIYVGDAPGDINACKAIGIPIIAVAWADTAEPEKLKELLPEQLFLSIIEFTNWLSSEI